MIGTKGEGTFQAGKQIEKNGMHLIWRHSHDSIHLEMSAPSTGWLAIGFNSSADLAGTYLLMGRLSNNRAEVVEHSIIQPGDYRSFSVMGFPGCVKNIRGEEKRGTTRISFSLPNKPENLLQKDLREGNRYHLLLAYSVDKDFRHHSLMRTSIIITL